MKSNYGMVIQIDQLKINFFSQSITLKKALVLDHHSDTLIYADAIDVQMESLPINNKNFILNNAFLNQAFVNIRTYPNEDSPNITQWIEKFSSPGKAKTQKAFEMLIREASLNNCRVWVRTDAEGIPDAAFQPNDIRIESISANLSDFAIHGDSIMMNLNTMKAKEKSGLALEELKARVLICSTELDFRDLKLHTPQSRLSGYFSMRYTDWSKMSSFIDSVTMVADLNLSSIHFNDIAYFTNALKGTDASFRIKGGIKGPLSKLKAKGLSVYFGSITQIDGDAVLSGLPDIKNTLIDFKLKKMITSYYDLEMIPVPPFDKGNKLQIPEEIKRMGVLKFNGSFFGFINDFYANGNLVTQAGNIITDITLRPEGKTLSYDGKLELQEFDLGKILDIRPALGKVSLNGELHGIGLDVKEISTTFKGNISSLEANQYVYHNIKVDAGFTDQVFKGAVQLRDANAGLDFSGSINFKNSQSPVYNFTSNINQADLKTLNLVSTDSLALLSASVNANFSGKTIDDLVGYISINDFSYTASPSKKIQLPGQQGVYLNVSVNTDLSKQLMLRSAFVDANVKGNYQLINFINDVKSRINQILPSAKLKVDEQLQSIPQKFNYDVHLKQIEPVLNVFLPELSVSKGVKLDGVYNSQDNEITLHSSTIKSIEYKSLKMVNWNIEMNNSKGGFNLNSNAAEFYFNDSLQIDNVIINANANQDTLTVWTGFYNNGKRQNSASINAKAYVGNIPRFEFNFFDSYFYFNDSLWNIGNDNRIVLDSAFLEVDNVAITPSLSRYPMITINGKNTPGQTLPIRLSLNDFPVNFSDFFLNYLGVDLDGMTNGKIELYQLFSSSPYFTSDLTVSDLSFNKIQLGELSLVSKYNTEDQGLIINSILRNKGVKSISISNGRYYPFRKDDQLNLDVSVESLELSMFEKMIAPVFMNLTGTVSGNVLVSGSTRDPNIESSLSLSGAGLRVGFTNVFYQLELLNNKHIVINNKNVLINDILLKDRLGNKGILKGSIQHELFKDMKLDLSMSFNNLNVLETTPKIFEQFYGNAFVTGKADIKGPINDLVLDASVMTEKNTVLNIPIQSSSEIDEKNFVVFLQKDTTEKESSVLDQNKINSNFTVNLNVKATPDASCRVIFDETVGDVITAFGKSENLSLSIDSKDKFEMYGVYEITKGDYLFTLQNLINKQFQIKPGSNITWSGNPYQALINATAVYTANAPLYPIVSAFLDPTQAETFKRTSRINCELNLGNKLSNPQISFNMDLPNTDEGTKNLVKSTIVNEDEMNRQVFALLLMNQFLPPESTGGTNSGGNIVSSGLGSGLGSSSLELLAGQLNNWLSKLTKDISLNLKYKAGDKETADQVNVALSTQLFNQRLIIDGDIGVGGQRLEQGTSQTQNQIVGNVTVELKATNDGRLRLKAFNRSNENNLLKNSAAYTQGAGISFRREFDTWGDLFIRRKKSKKK